MKNKLLNINFDPMIAPLSQNEVNNIKYEPSLTMFNFLPQWFLLSMKKLQLVIFFSPFAYAILMFILGEIFHVYILFDYVMIVFPILIILTMITLSLNVHSNVQNMRENNFSHQNSNNVFWKSTGLNSNEYEEFDIEYISNILTNDNRYAETYNVLALKDSKISTGDIKYRTQNSDSDEKDIIISYSAIPIKTNICNMILNRKKLDYTHLKRLASIKLPDGVADTLFVNSVHRTDSEHIINELQKNNLGQSLEKLFIEYPHIVSVKIFNDLLIITWLYPIEDKFDSTQELSNKIVDNYRNRILSIYDLVDIIKK